MDRCHEQDIYDYFPISVQTLPTLYFCSEPLVSNESVFNATIYNLLHSIQGKGLLMTMFAKICKRLKKSCSKDWVQAKCPKICEKCTDEGKIQCNFIH